ncbi:hypothetical protein N7520_009715 [Penicillium odoratum]|uniref:uncharacterized protein n=1 Tax=Penicillium odoratum TaxID=1167516 RepID=UPI002546EBB9|nr:uncharacterized protein N7520_009715 [Penicillium odoratum]KAJ5752798.1 hypothetical protein N7520_009715 [Penicillium odoratum]
MKREAPSEIHGCNGDGDVRPAKARRRESPSTESELWKEEHEHSKAQHPLSPFSPDCGSKVSLDPPLAIIITLTAQLPDALEQRTPTSLANTTDENTDTIYQWIPAPPEVDPLEVMSQPPSKRSRSRSISTDRGRARSVSSDNSESSSARDTRSYAYRAVNYVTILETKGCFMRQSSAGPVPEDIALCERLLSQPIEPPIGTMLEDEYITDFHIALQNRSEARLLVDLHPLIMPCAENQYIQGNKSLKDVIDGYNDPWLKTEPIYGPKPQPDHARGLRWSAFSETQRRKLGIKPDEKSPYTVREDMYFPYLTAEIKCGNQALELADRQNMHSMCIALRAVVSLCQAAGCTEEVHRRILGFSISHELEGFRIYGYYPEIDDGKVSFYRWPVAQPNVWVKENRWTCYQFVENLDREFLPIHTHRLMRILEKISDPNEDVSGIDVDELDSQVSMVGLQERPGYRRAASLQNRGLQPELRIMVQTLQQQLADQKEREEKRVAEQKEREEKLLVQLEQQRLREERREAEQKEREEKLLVQLEQQRLRIEKREAEQKEREEKLLVQLEQQRLREEKREAEQKELQGKLFALLEQRENSK